MDVGSSMLHAFTRKATQEISDKFDLRYYSTRFFSKAREQRFLAFNVRYWRNAATINLNEDALEVEGF